MVSTRLVNYNMYLQIYDFFHVHNRLTLHVQSKWKNCVYPID